MQGSKWDADENNRLMEFVEIGEGGMILENSSELCMLPYAT